MGLLRRCVLVVLPITGLLAAAGCGSSSSGGGGGAAQGSTSQTHMVDGIKFPMPEKTSVSLAASGKATIGLLPFLTADKLGIWKKFGVDVKVHEFEGDAQALQALLAGQADVGGTSGGPALSSLTTSKPLTFTFVARDNLTDVLLSRPDIPDAAALKGKSVAISSFGSQSNAGAVLSVTGIGLKRDDVTFTPVGDDTARLAALESGAVGAAIQDDIKTKQMTAKGYHALFELNTLPSDKGFIRDGLDVPVAFMKENPNTTLALTAAMLEATTEMVKPERLDDVAQAWAADSGEPLAQAKDEIKTELADDNYRPLSGFCTPALLTFMKSLMVQTNPKLKTVDPKQACTNEYLQKLDQMGFQKAIGAPDDSK